mgnify:CR=1 FL=1
MIDTFLFFLNAMLGKDPDMKNVYEVRAYSAVIAFILIFLFLTLTVQFEWHIVWTISLFLALTQSMRSLEFNFEKASEFERYRRGDLE